MINAIKSTILSLVILMTFAPAYSQNDDIVSIGEGRGANESEALMAAKRDAVEKGIGVILLSQTEVENFMVKRDLVISKTMGSVKKYELISKTKEQDGLFKVKIKATISKVAMKNDLATFNILLESMNKPKVMVIIKENNVGNEEPVNMAAENAIIDFLKVPYGFEIVDQRVVETIKASAEKMASLEGNASVAASIGAQFGAEVVITGTAVSRVAENLSYNLGGMKSVQADVTLRAVNCASGRIIATGSAHAAKVHISPNTAGTNAIAAASKKATKLLLDKIIVDWNNQVNNGIPLALTVKGVLNFRLKNEVKKTLTGIAGVSAVRERGWNSSSGYSQFDLEYKGNAEGFCTKADGYRLSAGGSLAVTGQNGTNITLTVEPK